MTSLTELDVRGLPPPEPFEKIMQALQTLSAGTELQVRIHREPFPLYDVLRDSGFAWQTDRVAEDEFRITISRRP